MAEVSFPFDSAPSYEDAWASMARLWSRSGIVASSGSPALGTGLQFVLPVGFEANVEGFYYRVDGTALTKTATPNGSTQPRLDQLVLRLDRTANAVNAFIKSGTPSASPVLPALTTTSGSGGVWEIPVSYALCPGSGSPQNYSGLTLNGPISPYTKAPVTGSPNTRPTIQANLLRSDGSPIINSGTTDLRVANASARKHRTTAEGGWTVDYLGRGLAHPRWGLWRVWASLPTDIAGARYLELQALQDNLGVGDEGFVLGVDVATGGFGNAIGGYDLWVPEGEQLRLVFGTYNSGAAGAIRSGAIVKATWLDWE